MSVQIAQKRVGPGQPVFIVAEIGLNHNGDIDLARQLIDVAVDAGCDLVKLQKRTPHLCTPREQWDVRRETPWGEMRYIEYRERIEFGMLEYGTIAQHCARRGILWTASAWDVESVRFLEAFEVPCHKVPSACLTDHELLGAMRETGKPIILSTGMSTSQEIEDAMDIIDGTEYAYPLVVLHCTSTYPCPPDELNLRCIDIMQQDYDYPIGYSGHETGLATTIAAVALGACLVERHITLDRTMWGSDQAASLEPQGLRQLVKHIRTVEQAMGDGLKRVYESELPAMAKLRRVKGAAWQSSN